MANIADIDFGSESDDGGDFNPAPAVGSDEEAESDSEKPKIVKSASKASSRKPTPPPKAETEDEPEDDGAEDEEEETGKDVNGGYDEEEEDLDEEEEEDEEDAVTGRPRKRARRDPRNQFIDIEAEVDDEDEGDDDLDEDEGAGAFIAENHPDDVADLPPGTETDDRRHRELDRKREMEQQLDAEKQAALLKERYGRSRTTATETALVPKRLLLPSVDDPSIWGVRCKPGKEREVVFSIMKRIDERALTKNPLPLSSAFERGGTAMVGYVYVEARKQSDILLALDGIMNVYPRTKMVLVSIKEMPDLLRVTKSEQLQANGYVRIKRGKYAGDLAMIDDVESNGLEVTLKIVPRLDYGLNEDANGPGSDGPEAQKRKRAAFGLSTPTARPPQRLFSEAEAKKKHSRYLQSMSTFDKKHWTYLNDTYVNGYLIKDFKIQHLITQNVNPTLEEVTKFAAGNEDGTENLDLTALAASLKNNTSSDNFLPGDIVEVYDGEQQGISGKATTVRGDIVTLTVTEGELKGQQIEVPTKGLRKRFREGDHVKVIGGSSRFRDEVGMVVRLKDDRVTILSDLSMQEITVFSKDLREATDTGVAGGLGRYDIHDLVQLDPATVGCVTKVDRESLRVLDQNGSVRSVMPSQISNKIERRRHAVATDRNGSEIRQDDTVREVGGEGKQGVIVHIHRSFLFLHNREQTENSGIFVVRATNVATVAAKGGRVSQQASTGPDLAKMNPALQRNGANGANSMPPPKSFGRDRAIGQTVTIRKGPYKGLLGIIKDTTDAEARVELHTKSKTIQVSKEVLAFKDPISGNSMDYQSFSSRGRGRGMPGGVGGGAGMGGSGGFGGATPRADSWAGSRTPMAGGMSGGRTPAWGAASSRTPAWSDGGGSGGGSTARTPRWQQESSSAMAGGRTPAWTAEGGRTSYGGGGGGRTPAWDSGSRTAYGGSTFGSGSKTPAYSSSDSSSRTPAYNPQPSSSSFGGTSSNGHTSNSRPLDAPTPAAPTPGGGVSSQPYSAPTPGGGPATYSAPTPYVSAPTPGGPSTSHLINSAPTPYASAPTPAATTGGAGAGAPTPRYGAGGGYDAPTPMAGGVGAPTPYFSGGVDTPAWAGDGDGEDDDGEGEREDDGPRYEEDEDE